MPQLDGLEAFDGFRGEGLTAFERGLRFSRPFCEFGPG